MPRFQYRGRGNGGNAVNGVMEAPSPDAVARMLTSGGVTPIDISPAKESSNGLEDLRARLRESAPDLSDLIMFSRQMYTLSRAGVPLGRALRGLSETTRNEVLSRALAEVSDGLESGRTLSQSLARHPQVFNQMYVSVIQVGEDSGHLEEAFLELSRHIELDRDTRDRIKTAMRYPMIVIVTIAIAMGLINAFVIPAFAQVFEGFNTELPLATRILLGTSEFTVKYWPLLLGLLAGAVFGVRAWLRTERGRYTWDRQRLRLPLVGGIIHRATLARFARSFAMVLNAGVPLLQGLGLVARAVGNEYVADRLLGMRSGIERGDTLTRTATSSELFTPLVLQMLSVGEETGNIEELLREVAEYYDREVDADLKSLSSAIEPILIVGIGVIVLVLALGVFLPMWDLSSAAQGG